VLGGAAALVCCTQIAGYGGYTFDREEGTGGCSVPPPASCPAATGGPTLVPVCGGYCIDATEVTRDQYAAWLGTSPVTGGQPAYCSWNTSFTPSCEWPPGAKGARPVVCVDWCDAYAYCKAVGKRLCGKIGGGSNGYSDFADARVSQWYNACSSGGAHTYPYGGAGAGGTSGYQATTCNGWDKGVHTTVPVGSCSG
jgi:formylglycine-generating enzyme required for sulfatase activity